MRVAGEQLCVKLPCRGIHDGIGGGELVLTVEIGGEQGNSCVEGCHYAFLRIGNHLVRLVFSDFAGQPFR